MFRNYILVIGKVIILRLYIKKYMFGKNNNVIE